MDKDTAQALHDLQQTARLSADSDYLVRDTLGLVSDEEREEHDERVKREKAEVKTSSDDESGANKATGVTKKAS